MTEPEFHGPYDTAPAAGPVDADREGDFEELARILNRIQRRSGDVGVLEAMDPPVHKLYDRSEARAIEHIATARGMLLGELLNEAENEFNRRLVDLLTSALTELVPHD